MAGVVYALVQYGYNQTAGWVKLLCHYPATHLGHLACSLFPLFTLLLSHFKKLKLQLPGGNCRKGIAKMELPGGNCEKGIAKKELPVGNYEKQFFGLLLPMGKLTICTHGSCCAIPYGRASPPARLS